MRGLSSKVKDLPVVVTSAVVVESAARFRDSVDQLLDPQSAMNHLLSYGTELQFMFHSFMSTMLYLFFLFPY